MDVQEVVKAVETEVKKVEGEVVAAAEKVIERVTQELTSDEKLAIREIENTYLKAQMEIQRFSQATQKAQGDFTATVERLTKKYVVPVETWVFDNVTLTFRKK
jgi:uncharacterized protein (DUF342 family)